MKEKRRFIPTSKNDNGHIHKGAGNLGDFTTVNRRMLFLCLAALAIGLSAASIAVVLLNLIDLFTNLFYFERLSLEHVSPSDNHLGLLAVVVPIVGGLIIGLMARYGSERIRGHGIPEAIEAILIGKSKMKPTVTILKPVATGISIGSGGPFGAEGPVIMTGGAFGSLFAQFLRLTSMERKTLLVAGATAGMAAVFNSPISAVLLAVELLLFEWKPRSLIPVGVAAFAATVMRGALLGTGPIFPLAETTTTTALVPDVLMALSAVVIGLAAGGLSTALTSGVYFFEDLFHKLPIHWMWWPAIGGIAIGLGGLVAPQALGVGYDTIGALLAGNMAFGFILVLVLVKAVIWIVSLGSGTSGGVLAPLLIIGGSLGAIIGQFLPSGSPELWTLVSMGAMIGGVMRVPFTGVIFAIELTHDVNAMLPLAIAAFTAEAITVFSMKRSILTEKIARRGLHVSREYSVDALELIPVRMVMRDNYAMILAHTPVSKLEAIHTKSQGKIAGYPVVDAVGSLVGFLDRAFLAEKTWTVGKCSVA
jgi:CIC family chloride channel protein